MKNKIAFVDFTAHADFIDFNYANFGSLVREHGPSTDEDTLLRSLVYRPTIFQRKDVRWIAAHAWRSGAKERGVKALKTMKERAGPIFTREAAEPIAALIRQLFGWGLVEAVTCIPCGHSCRTDCFGKLLAQAVAERAEVRFVQVFADRPLLGVSHPKQSAKLPPLRQIARPPGSTIVVDDLATSGEHLEQAVLALRRIGIPATAMAWISGSTIGGSPLLGDESGLAPQPSEPRRARGGLDLLGSTNRDSGQEHSG